MLTVGRAQALGWRLQRQHLAGGAASPEEVVRTLAAVSQHGSDPDLAVRRRLADPGEPGVVWRALEAGRLLRVYSFRGSVQVMSPVTAGDYLALRAAGRQWERRSWVDHYRLTAEEWPDLRALVRDVVAAGPVPPQAIADVLDGHARLGHLAAEFAVPNHTLLKALCWQGDIAIAPSADGAFLLQSPAAARGWAGVPPLEEAGPRAVRDYLHGYGPASPEHVHRWLGEGLSAGRGRLVRWWGEVLDELVEVEVEGEARWVLASDADELAAAPRQPVPRVVLLPGKDDWVMGPGTKDTWVVPTAHRPDMTRGSAPVVVDGVVAGTWRRAGDAVEVVAELPRGASEHLAEEVTRLGDLLGAELSLRTP